MPGDETGLCMIDDSSLFSAIASGDMKAAEIFTNRFAAPLFRYCRLNFTDHYRASEFVENIFAVWINRFQRCDTELQDVCFLFEEAFRSSSEHWRDIRGKGLSGKQRRILELMEKLPIKQRLAIDLVLLENHDRNDVARWLDIESGFIDTIVSGFLETLSKDPKIKEILEHAAVHQSRERRKAAAQGGTPSSGYSRHSKGLEQRPKDNRQRSSEKPKKFKTDPIRSKNNTETAENSGRVSTGKQPSPDEERKKPGPRRRRVDPREINVDL